MRRICVLFLLAMVVAGGCASKPKFTEEELAEIPFAQRDGLPRPTGGFVMVISGEKITADEIADSVAEHFKPYAEKMTMEQFKAQARMQIEGIVTSKISDLVLYKKAKEDMSEGMEDAVDKAIDTETRKFLAGFGNDYAKAEASLREMGMSWQDFREYQKKMILSQSYLASKMPKDKPITRGEMIKYYNARKELFNQEAKLQFRLIDIDLTKQKTAEAGAELAATVMERLEAGEDFGELAKEYSDGYRGEFGGLWKPIQPDSLAEPYDVIATEAEKIEVGQVAGPIEAGEHIFIMKLEDKQEESVVPFEEVQNRIEAQIGFDRRRYAVDEVGRKLMQEAAVSNKEAFVDFCVEEIYRKSNAALAVK